MKKIYHLALMLMAFFALASCTPTVDDVFDKSSAERISTTTDENMQVLTGATNGWVMQYYAGSLYGGYNVLCKFNADQTVTASSEMVAPDSVFTSHFKLEQSQGIVLSFDAHNPIFHYFSDPHNPDNIGEDGKGMEGDFEFRVLKANADSVILQGKKHNRRIVMTPLASNVTWKDYLTKIEEIEEKMTFKYFNYIVGTDTVRIAPSYHTMPIPNTDKDGNTADVDVNYIYTLDGIQLYKPYEINGNTITGFKYNANGSNLFSENSNGNIFLGEAVVPLSEQLISGDWYLKMSAMGKLGQKYWGVIPDIQQQLGEELKMTALTTVSGRFGFYFVSGKYAGFIHIDYTLIDDSHIQLKVPGTGTSNGTWYLTNAHYNYLVEPFGYTKARTFEVKGNDPKSPTELTLTEIGNADNVITIFASPISAPLDN